MKKEIALLIVNLFLTCYAVAKIKAGNNTEKKHPEFKNSVCLVGTAHYFTKMYGPFLKYATFDRYSVYPTTKVADQFGLYYERKIFKNLRIGVGYTKWNTFFLHGIAREEYVLAGGFDTAKRGSIVWRYKYSMADLVFIYRYNRFKKHKIDVSIGPSYTYGLNYVFDTLYYGHIAESHQEHADYYGITAGIGYDFLCLSNRVAVGGNFRWRKYFNLFGAQIDYGFHIKFNF